VVALTFLGSLTLRYILSVYLWLNHADPGFSNTFWGDSRTYDFWGSIVANGWSDGSTFSSWKETVEGRTNRGFIYFVAAVYYIFGHNPLLVQFINGIIGTLTAICIFDIGIILGYDRKVATIAMLFTAFFPQMIFWSAAMYKDPSVMLCIALNILATLRMKERFRFDSLFLYLFSALLLLWLRFYIFYALVGATAVSFLFSRRRGLFSSLSSQVLLASTFVLLFLFTPMGKEMLSIQHYLNLEQLHRSRADLASAGSGYQAQADVSTPMGALRILPMGVLFLLFSPFPWTVSNLRQMLALPDVLVWYAMMPALLRGLYSALRHRLTEAMPILLFTATLTIAYGVFQGNAGTAYRQRTQIMMFYFLFVADGLSQKQRREQEGLQAAEAELTTTTGPNV
jgi:4-amino-4-deoxy-L-arabinose transferase-like glycosyltransferase